LSDEFVKVTYCKEEYPVSKHVYLVDELFEYFQNLPVSIGDYNHSRSELNIVFLKMKLKNIHTRTSQPLITRISFFSS
jgi:hypothetical protein